VEAVAGEALPAADAPVDPARPHRIFLEAARDAGAAVIDPLPTLASYARSASPYYRRDFHLNPAGNVALAVALHGALAGGPDGGPMEGIDGGALLPPRAEGAPTVLPAGPEDAGQGPPSWLLWYLGLTALLGTMYVRTYRDVPAAVGLGSVAALLAVVFGTALGVGWVVEELPPRAAQLTVLALVLAILTFILYKLGDRIGTIGELLRAFTLRGHWYLMPLLSVLLTVGSLLVVAASSPLVAPFIYTLF